VSAAIEHALNDEEHEYAEVRWSDALSDSTQTPRWGGVRLGNRLFDSRTLRARVQPDDAFAPIQRIGGSTGWYYANWLWSLRGWIDMILGGVGMRRRRRDSDSIKTGDTIDFWRVQAFEPGRRLRLLAGIEFPGRAWLEFEVTPDGDGSIIRQTCVFDPVGLIGLLYWFSVYPLHQFLFAGMLRGIVRTAELTSRRL
jgi:hypothetical protein